jgi:hypothetical protein
MAGSYPSRFGSLASIAIVAIAAAATATCDRIVSCWHSSRAALAAWLVEVAVVRMPRLTADWSRPDIAVRVKKDGTIAMRSAPKRRPTVFPGWRMAPSI